MANLIDKGEIHRSRAKDLELKIKTITIEKETIQNVKIWIIHLSANLEAWWRTNFFLNKAWNNKKIRRYCRRIRIYMSTCRS